MKVRIYAQRNTGLYELGAIVLKDGQLVSEPKIPALNNLLNEPLIILWKDHGLPDRPGGAAEDVSGDAADVRARVILLDGEGGGMTAKIETKNDVIKDLERRVHQHDARQLFAKMRSS